MSTGTRHVVRIGFLFVFIFVGFSAPMEAQTENVLYRFGGVPSDGFEPAAPLLLDGSGNLIGTTTEGSDTLCDLGEVHGCGIVYELVKSSSGYTEKVLYSFGSSSPTNDGASPMAGLIVDAAGNLYGTTRYGGSSNCIIDIGADGCGTVFELVKSSTGYTERVLHAFTGFDGAYPLAGLNMDASGNLYGTTLSGGANGFGTVFELVDSSGSYTEKVLYSFGASAADGEGPLATLVMDAAGNLFGTTSEDGGPFNCGLTSCGTVFELVKSSSGYTEKVLYTFTESSGANPMSGLIIDSSGNLYGTTSNGGTFGFGTAFELINASGNYTETVLHHFGGTPADGVMPVASLLMDGAGNLFGTTKMGGSATACGGLGCGTVFELVNSSGNYTEKLLHSFGGAGDGENAAAPLIMDSAGNLYSTTEVGGSNLSLGTVFEINPTADAPAVMLSTSALTFDQIAGTSSPPQAITVTNTGLANLIFGSNGVTLSGANIAGFSISADTCSNQIILPAATCSVSVTFSPTVFGTESGALTFSDNAVNSSQTVSLIGTALENSLTTVTSSNSSITVGTNVTFFARVAPTTGGPTPTGTVQFTANGSAIGSAGLSSGSAQISTSALAAGSISIVAAYGGDSIYAASNGLFTETVIGPPSYTVTANPAALTIVAPGQSVSTILTFTSQNGLTGAGTLSSPTCGISASEKISCSLAAFTLPANGTATSVLTFMSTAASMTTPSVLGGPQTGPPTASCRIIQIQVLVYLLFFSVIAFAFHSKDRCLNVLFAALLIAVAITSVNCGGSGGGGGGNPSTPIGPVQGLSVSISINGTTRTVPNLTLTVQ